MEMVQMLEILVLFFRLAGGGHSNALDFGVEDASPYPAWIQGTDRGSSDGHAGTYGLCLNPQGEMLA